MLGGIGATEIIIVLVIALVVFGPGKLPQLGQAVGKTIKGFKESTKGVTSDFKEATKEITDIKDDVKSVKDGVTLASKKSE